MEIFLLHRNFTRFQILKLWMENSHFKFEFLPIFLNGKFECYLMNLVFIDSGYFIELINLPFYFF